MLDCISEFLAMLTQNLEDFRLKKLEHETLNMR